jgi:hypothetical protein
MQKRSARQSCPSIAPVEATTTLRFIDASMQSFLDLRVIM